MSRTRIVIFQLKEIIYTAVFVGFGILLLVILFFMFWPGRAKETSNTTSSSALSQNPEDNAGQYIAGVYTSTLTLGDAEINLRVSLDEDRVKSVEIVNLEDSVETMYPLIKPAVKEISDQLAQNITPDQVVLSDDSPYTSQLILDAVCEVMNNAAAD